jgi:hypothetical protein
MTTAFDQIKKLDAELAEQQATKKRPLEDALRLPADDEASGAEQARAEVDRLKKELRSTSRARILGLATRADVEKLTARIATEEARAQRAEAARAVLQLGRDEIQDELNQLSARGQGMLRRRSKLCLAALVDEAEAAAQDYLNFARAAARARMKVQAILELREAAQTDAIRSRAITEAEKELVSPEGIAAFEVPGFRHLHALGGGPQLVVSMGPRIRGNISVDADEIRANTKAELTKKGLLA